jgi:nucleotide-binding universal stress UspA family protein
MVQSASEEARVALTPSPRYKSLLVPVDGPFGEHALPLALGIARRAGAEVRVVHIHCPLRSTFQTDLFYPNSGLDDYLRRRQQAYLDDLFRRLVNVTSVPVTPVFLQAGEVADALCAAASVGTDLVVMATHGRGLLGRRWSGSVTDALMRRLSVPLLLVRGYNAPADLTGDPPVRNVLIPLDGTEFAERVLEPALALGTLTGADHTLLQVIPAVTDCSLAYPGRQLADIQRAQTCEYLRRTADRLNLGGRTPRIHPRIIYDEQPVASSIVHYARTPDADLIALATHGRRGLARLFRSSVTDRVIQGTDIPVLVYRPDTAQEERVTP